MGGVTRGLGGRQGCFAFLVLALGLPSQFSPWTTRALPPHESSLPQPQTETFRRRASHRASNRANKWTLALFGHLKAVPLPQGT